MCLEDRALCLQWVGRVCSSGPTCAETRRWEELTPPEDVGWSGGVPLGRKCHGVLMVLDKKMALNVGLSLPSDGEMSLL